MTQPLTANAVSAQLANLSKQLDELVTRIGEAEVKAVNAREDYTLALSKAFLKAEGAMDVRKHASIETTHHERLAAELAETEVRGLRRSIDTVKVRIDVGRSVSSAMKAEMGLAGGLHG